MRAQCVDDVPHRFELRPSQDVRRVISARDVHRDDDRAFLLSRCEPDGAPDRLHDVDLATPRVDERDAVKAWNVDTFGEAAGIRENPVFVVGDSSKLVQLFVAVTGGHGA